LFCGINCIKRVDYNNKNNTTIKQQMESNIREKESDRLSIRAKFVHYRRGYSKDSVQENEPTIHYKSVWENREIVK
jgi:type IV secretory pathway component VirB8